MKPSRDRTDLLFGKFVSLVSHEAALASAADFDGAWHASEQAEKLLWVYRQGNLAAVLAGKDLKDALGPWAAHHPLVASRAQQLQDAIQRS